MRALLPCSDLESMKGSDRSATALEAPPTPTAEPASDAALGAALVVVLLTNHGNS